MKTKNVRLSFAVLVVLTTVFLGACVSATTEIAYNDPAPQTRKCTLLISANFTVTSIDGAAVNWSANPGDQWMSVQLSEGNHTFFLNYRRIGAEIFQQENIEYQQADFLAGRTYRMYGEEGVAGVTQTLLVKMDLILR